MYKYCAKNVNFIINLTPNKDGRIDANLVSEYKKIGEKIEFPELIDELPQGWLIRE